ncbi:hypothetical protein E3N88_13736 [Mikania micrantha]|uniref:Uncharacterized protein n=1 Tax=Mikania micrantha TaxID=192012 RepID=A0A5N6P218_9ASTR|nr:hypothetical protein E3N88_13736 [Mikania micrantha]
MLTSSTLMLGEDIKIAFFKAETDAQKMESWKMALTEIADLKGRDVNYRKETEFIQEVVADIHRRLPVPLGNTLPPLIGIDDEIEYISSWLTDGSSNTVDILTVVGVGGIGKTSLAKYVFQLHSNKFHKSSFIEGINETCKKNLNGMLDLQKQLFGDISKGLHLQIHDVSVYASKIKNALAHKKVLLVLDDVGCLDQLDVLLGNETFHQGSKIIITTKDASLTERCALFDLPVQTNHEKLSFNGLYRSASLELLCIHAFKSNKPEEGYKEASEKLVEYCQGHPLALKVLGRSLWKRDVEYWEECIKVLKKEPHSQVNNTLKMSFDALLFENDKELFKHIACFFVGIDRDVTETILNSCDRNARYGITNLIERCLLSIRWNNKLEMHSLIQEMGRDLVRQESPNRPWERSRIWCYEESFKVLEQKQGTGNLVGLVLDMRMLDKEKLRRSLQLKTDALSKMDKLKLLQLNYVKINGSYENVSKELRWLCMHGFHLKSIPSELPLEKVVVLDMSYSKIESFDMSYSTSQQFVSRLKGLIGLSSKDKRLLGSLKILDLSFCELLHSVGGFYLLPALERLILENCTALIEVCESIEQCDELVHIDLRYCYKLKKLPKSLCKLKVKTLLLDGCTSCQAPIEMENEVIPSDLKFTMIRLLSSLRILSLKNNNLSNKCFPKDLSCLAMLEKLYLDENPIVSMPNCVRTLPRLKLLSLNGCEDLTSIENPPCTLSCLSLIPRDIYNPSIRKIKFDLEMSPLRLLGAFYYLLPCEIDDMLKIQDMASVEEKVLHSLGWTYLKFTKELVVRTFISARASQQIQISSNWEMYYEFGIFSTFYKGKEMPEWINCRSKGPSISFTIPSSVNNLRGLNFLCILKKPPYLNNTFEIPSIKIINITETHTWVYRHYIDGVEFDGNKHYYEDSGEGEENYEDAEENFEDAEENSKDGEEYCLSWLSHWMFGPNEMKVGDHIIINVGSEFFIELILECGIGLVYDDDDDGKIGEEEEDVLGYYKSWNHIIGGDLSPFQTTTGEYILDHIYFYRLSNKTSGFRIPFTYGANFKGTSHFY